MTEDNKEKQFKVLIVEDEEFLAGTLSKKLTNNGYAVVIADNGAEAVTKAKSEKPDIILLDLILPEKSGFEVLKEIRGDVELKDTPVIILSNLNRDEDVNLGKDLGAVEYYIKANINLTEIVEKIDARLKKQ